jgi:hypothetical protein
MDKSDLYISKANFVQFRTDNITDVYDFQKVSIRLISKLGEELMGWFIKLDKKNQARVDGEQLKKLLKKQLEILTQ